MVWCMHLAQSLIYNAAKFVKLRFTTMSGEMTQRLRHVLLLQRI